MRSKRKRLKQGRDWHGWAWLAKGSEWRAGGCDGLFNWAEPERPKDKEPTDDGYWVRVRFTKVASR